MQLCRYEVTRLQDAIKQYFIASVWSELSSHVQNVTGRPPNFFVSLPFLISLFNTNNNNNNNKLTISSIKRETNYEGTDAHGDRSFVGVYELHKKLLGSTLKSLLSEYFLFPFFPFLSYLSPYPRFSFILLFHFPLWSSHHPCQSPPVFLPWKGCGGGIACCRFWSWSEPALDGYLSWSEAVTLPPHCLAWLSELLTTCRWRCGVTAISLCSRYYDPIRSHDIETFNSCINHCHCHSHALGSGAGNSPRTALTLVHSTWTELTWRTHLTRRPSHATRSLVTHVTVTTIYCWLIASLAAAKLGQLVLS